MSSHPGFPLQPSPLPGTAPRESRVQAPRSSLSPGPRGAGWVCGSGGPTWCRGRGPCAAPLLLRWRGDRRGTSACWVRPAGGACQGALVTLRGPPEEWGLRPPSPGTRTQPHRDPQLAQRLQTSPRCYPHPPFSLLATCGSPATWTRQLRYTRLGPPLADADATSSAEQGLFSRSCILSTRKRGDRPQRVVCLSNPKTAIGAAAERVN